MTQTKPTTTGFYWWKYSDGSEPTIVKVSEKGCQIVGDTVVEKLDNIGGWWSEAPIEFPTTVVSVPLPPKDKPSK